MIEQWKICEKSGEDRDEESPSTSLQNPKLPICIEQRRKISILE
jgi:hypothetical protein